jgi:hypothetical protein
MIRRNLSAKIEWKTMIVEWNFENEVCEIAETFAN